MELQEWLDAHLIEYEMVAEKFLLIGEEVFLILYDKDKIISSDFNLILDEEEQILSEESTGYVFQFGSRWYYSHKDELSLKELVCIGESKTNKERNKEVPFLGLHGKYELLNGSGRYDQWCEKAKWLGHTTLGICETQTLAGIIDFQQSCSKVGIKPILGHTAYVKAKELTFNVKLFVKNKKGWRNLLHINKIQLVNNVETKHISFQDLIKRGEGLYCVLLPEIEYPDWVVSKLLQSDFESVYYQLDFTEWKSDRKEKEWLEALRHYFVNYSDFLPPILACDSYYVHKTDAEIKKQLNDIGKNKFVNQSEDQHFKSVEEMIEAGFKLFSENDKSFFNELTQNAIQCAKTLQNECNYQVPLNKRYLPKYELTPAEKELATNVEELFWIKIDSGLEERVVAQGKDLEIYAERLEKEVEILQKGNIIDYFLILSDICQWCRGNDILVGHGRGSAGGSLVSYLLGIIQIDPIEHGLIFERFLTEGRIMNELPDIDSDFSNRDAVVEYMKQRYGHNYVAAVATYGNMKVKNAIKDFGRINTVPNEICNKVTKKIPKNYENSTFEEIIKFSLEADYFYQFFKKYPLIFKNLSVNLNNPRTSSIHACATIIFPKEDEEGLPVDIFDLVPVKLMDGQLVIEWEGEQLAKAGFLKEDILGLSQLEKFEGMLKLIKQNYPLIDIDIYKIPLDDPKVYDLFGKGLNEDVFQFGSPGLKAYTEYLKPDSINELTAANALYRPGAMESDTHNKYVEIKYGRERAEYDYLLEEVTSETYGLYIYQEQIMQAYQKITDVSLSEADVFRKVITKSYKDRFKNKDFQKYEDNFISHYIKKGQSPEAAQEIWEKLISFASYGFNKSHAAAYSIIGYLSQWFKVYYPLEFFTVSLQKSPDEERPNRLEEMKIYGIKASPPDINKSGYGFTCDKEENKIYYSLESIKGVGPSTLTPIVGERESKGRFYSFEEFFNRVNRSKVNKGRMEALILSGCFDEVEQLNSPKERLYILDKLFALSGYDQEIEKYIPYAENLFYWEMTQKSLCGYGDITYKKIVQKLGFKNFKESLENLKGDKYVTVAGVVEESFLRESPKAGKFLTGTISSNDEQIPFVIWNYTYENYFEKLLNLKGKVLILNGEASMDTYKNKMSIKSTKFTQIEIL